MAFCKGLAPDLAERRVILTPSVRGRQMLRQMERHLGVALSHKDDELWRSSKSKTELQKSLLVYLLYLYLATQGAGPRHDVITKYRNLPLPTSSSMPYCCFYYQ